jgi:hypothetical protein
MTALGSATRPRLRRSRPIGFLSAGCALWLFTAIAAQAAPPLLEGERAADPQEKVVCKRFIRTGSLVDSYKTCKTKHEWERERDNLRQLSVSDSCRDRANGGFDCKI